MYNVNSIMSQLPVYLMRIPVILLALTVHESAHGYAAYKLGDPTAMNSGRLTLNPLKHLDPIGTVMMLLFGFGWAKPVPIDARYFKRPRRDMALTALAGPFSNLLMAFVGVFVYAVAEKIFRSLNMTSGAAVYVIMLFLYIFYVLNLSFAVFNLLPIPPLDGSRVLFVLLPDRYYFGLMRYERYISLIMMLLLFSGLFSEPLSALVSLIENGMFWIVGLLPFI